MKEKREVISKIADLMTYKIRAGEISNEGGDKIWRVALEHPDKVDEIIDILDMELPEPDTIQKVQALV